jgi:hypothetical protein
MSDNDGKPFGGLSPSEAGKRRWEKERQRVAEAESSPESNGVLVVTTTDIDSIIAALRDKAKQGDVPAAREQRDWIEVRKEDDALRRDKRLLELLSPGQRACIQAVLREQPVAPDDALAAWCST